MKKISVLSALIFAALIVLTSRSWSQLPGSLTNGLVSYYTFDGNANDLSGNSNDLSAPNGIYYVVGRNGSLSAEMTNNRYFQLSAPLTTNDSFTWSIWFQPSTASDTYVAIMNQGFAPLTQSTVNPYLTLNDLFWTPSGGIAGVGGGQGVTSGDLTLTNNQWYNVIWTSDGIGNRSLFVNGILKGNVSGTDFGQSTDHFYIGGTPQLSTNSGFFNGMIDDVGIWNIALSGTEVTTLYNTQSVPEPSTYALLFLSGAASLWALRRRKG